MDSKIDSMRGVPNLLRGGPTGWLNVVVDPAPLRPSPRLRGRSYLEQADVRRTGVPALPLPHHLADNCLRNDGFRQEE